MGICVQLNFVSCSTNTGRTNWLPHWPGKGAGATGVDCARFKTRRCPRIGCGGSTLRMALSLRAATLARPCAYGWVRTSLTTLCSDAVVEKRYSKGRLRMLSAVLAPKAPTATTRSATSCSTWSNLRTASPAQKYLSCSHPIRHYACRDLFRNSPSWPPGGAGCRGHLS